MTVLADDHGAAVAAIIVTYNSAETVPILLESLRTCATRVRAIVVDNGSRDETLEVLRSYPDVVVRATGANLGYSGGINIGRRDVCPGEHVAILNPDLSCDEQALDRMLSVLQDESVGICAPQLRDLGDGSRFDSLRREPTVWRALGDSVFGNRWMSRPGWLAETFRRDCDYAARHDVAWAGGAALLVSATCNERVGAWDSATYFLYSEETDYARRARDAGFTVRYEPSAIVHHVGSGSGQPAPLVALISVNRIRYFERLHGRLHTALFRAAVAVQHLLRLYDPRHRYALPFVLDRRRWDRLPSADPTPLKFTVEGSRLPDASPPRFS